MIKGIGPVFTSRPASDVARVGNDAATARVEGGRTSDAAASPRTTAARIAAEGAPVDTARIEAIKARIARGEYAIDADAIAKAMIAQDIQPHQGPRGK